MSTNFNNSVAEQGGRAIDVLGNVQNEFDQLVIYKGRLAKRVNITTGSITLAARSAYPQPVESKVNGEIIGFTVSTNEPDMKVLCIIYDGEGDSDTIIDSTIKEVTYLGYGMTYGEAVEVDGTGISVDKTGTPHPINPYVLRYKDTFDNLMSTYDSVKGSAADKHYVLDYAPVIKEAYSRLFFTVSNESSQERMIHKLSFRRIDYLDKSEIKSSITDPYQIPVDNSVFDVPGEQDYE